VLKQGQQVLREARLALVWRRPLGHATQPKARPMAAILFSAYPKKAAEFHQMISLKPADGSGARESGSGSGTLRSFDLKRFPQDDVSAHVAFT
jgi:hypothetical protein